MRYYNAAAEAILGILILGFLLVLVNGLLKYSADYEQKKLVKYCLREHSYRAYVKCAELGR